MKEEIQKIYSRNDGRFEIRCHYGYKDDGTPNYRSIYGYSKTEVIQNYHNKIGKLFSENDLLIFDKTYIGYDINIWMNNSKIRNKKSTYSNYQYTLKSKIIPKFAKIKKKVISLEMINQFTENLLEDGLSAKSVKDILIILQQILKIGNINIKIPMPKVPKTEIQILSKEEQKKIRNRIIEKLQ